MKINRGFLFALVGLFISININSQTNNLQTTKNYADYPHWIEMMQDQSVNFYEVQNAFNAYWENREITKGSGWKPYKRWEWLAERHIYPDGTRHEADKVYKEYKSYISKNPQAKDSNGDWTNLGPMDVPSKGYAGLGRINAVAFHPTNPDIVYIGAPAGGFWKYDGTSGGWSSTTDDLPTLGVSSIIVDWNNPDNIFIGTGDRDAGDAPGLGVFKSADGGITWELWNNGMGSTTVGRMIQHPNDPTIMFAASSAGVFKTTDSGENWDMVKSGGTKDILFKPGNTNIMYAGGSGSFYRSLDSGENWDQITNGLPSGSRAVIAVTPDDPQYVYCLLSNGDSYKGIYRSTNGGDSFSEMSTSPNIMSWGCNGGSGGQAWYDLDVAVDPNNKDVIFAGGVNCFKSVDGGANWDISSHWWGDCNVPSVHADLHVLEYSPVNDRLYAGNDGGIYYTANGGSSWPEITDGLPISQVYKIGQCDINIDKVINGYQDNGTSTYYGSGTPWQTSYGGDGMECAFDHTDEAYSYATVYYGAVYRLFNNNDSHQVAGDGAHGMNEEGGWVTPFCLHEGNSDIMFGGYKSIWRAEGVKTNSFTWEKISENSGGNIGSVEHSPANYNIFYWARSSQLFRSDNVMDENPEWVSLASSLPGTGNVFDIESHPFEEDVVFITRGSKVYRSDDRGMSWTDLTGSLPNINMNSLAFYKNSIDGIYVGSDAGVYYREASMEDWVMFSNGLPVDASVNEIEIYHNPENPEEDVIRAGTYGRGLWSSPMWQGIPVADFEADETMVPVGCEINFFDKSTGVPTSWQWSFEGGTPGTSNDKNPQGVSYSSQGVFSVSLTVSNSEGSDSKTISGYIEVSETALPEVYFLASDSITCSGVEIQFADMSSNCPTDWLWEFDPSDVNFVNGTDHNSQNPEVEFINAGSYNVTLSVTNNAGTNSYTKENYIQIGGIAVPFYDDFESGSLDAKSWIIENPDFNVTWDIASVAGNQSDYAAFMNFFDYLVPPGPRDKIITPVLTFENMDEVYLSFQYAYAKRHASVTDSLIVLLSNDCGNSWTRLWFNGDDGNGSFATHELTTNPFVPEVSEDWCGAGWGADCVFLDLSTWAGQGNIQVAFESYNYFGNNLYIDNVSIGVLTDINSKRVNSEIAIFPNPTNGQVHIVIPEDITESVVSIINMQGVEVGRFVDGSTDNTLNINLSKFGKGIYFINVMCNEGTHVEKVIVN